MKTYSNEQPNIYDVSGHELRIHFDMQEIATEDGTQWQAEEVLCHVKDTRNQIIEKIIATRYSVGAELATINNQTNDPDAYAAYQAFRVLAKELADGYAAS